MARGIVVLPKSATLSRVTSNIYDSLKVKERLEADTEELKLLDGLAAGGKLHRFTRPPWGVPMGFADWE